MIERIEILLQEQHSKSTHPLYIDVLDTSLSRRWLDALTVVIKNQLHLEKNYCFLGWPESARDGQFLCQSINDSIAAINEADIGYPIDDVFYLDDIVCARSLTLDRHRLNRLHRYFEDLQGVSGAMTDFFVNADATTRWHIRQLNLLCHELETWALSWQKFHLAPEWVRPSQLMCWLLAPRFDLESQDLELFGLDSLYRDFGGVYVGVNKAIGKHHWEVFQDEGCDSRLSELTTSSMRGQTEAAADFDIEWARDTRGQIWMDLRIQEFRLWLTRNGFDPDDPTLTLGHPKVAQINLEDSFGHNDISRIWRLLNDHLDVFSVSVAGHTAIYDYTWQDHNYMQQQIQLLKGH